eukprot:scaffold11728_cov171-Amphora_coffeaeformis.AAC.7
MGKDAVSNHYISQGVNIQHSLSPNIGVMVESTSVNGMCAIARNGELGRRIAIPAACQGNVGQGKGFSRDHQRGRFTKKLDAAIIRSALTTQSDTRCGNFYT